MAYIEIKERNTRRYFYLVRSQRVGKRVIKKRKYLGVNLSPEAINKLKKNEIFTGKKSILEKIKKKAMRILKKRGIRRAGIFGSYARGEQKKDSDIDILIEPTKDMGFGFAGLEDELSASLNNKVDLVSYNGISKSLKEKILKEEIRII